MHSQNFRARLERLIEYLGVDQTEMGRRLGISRNMISMLLSKTKEQNPSRAVSMLFEQEWESAFGGSTSGNEQKILLSRNLMADTRVSETPAVYSEGGSTPEAVKALHGCDAVYDLLHRAASKPELAFAITSFDRAWNTYKRVIENTGLHFGTDTAELGGQPCQTNSAPYAVSSPPAPASTPHANVVPLPPQHFMSVEEAQSKGVKIPAEVLAQLALKNQNSPKAAPRESKRPRA